METMKKIKDLSSHFGNYVLEKLDYAGNHALTGLYNAYKSAKKPTAWILSSLLLGASAPVISPTVFAKKVEDTPYVQSGSDILSQNQKTLEDLLQVSNPDIQPGDISSPQIPSSNQTSTSTTEQVKEAQPWTLTDEYGNPDIMDNDDIVVHLPSNLSLDQISKIEWYRNGIQMRFVDPSEKVIDLTNALMKTFDGNPLEHSPTSNNTDHAIAGYNYKVEVDLKDGDVKILDTTVESTFKWHPELWAGMQSNWVDALQDVSYTDRVRFFESLKNDGFIGITLDVPYYLNSPSDNTLNELFFSNPKIIDAGIVTPSNYDLETMLKAIQEAGMETHVRIYLYISNKYRDQHGFVYSANISPSNPPLFFDNYTNLLLKIIPSLNKYHVKLFTPFVEMTSIERYSSLIKEMYTKLSKVFTGELGFDEETHNILKGQSPMQNGKSFEQFVRKFTFWNWTNPEGEYMAREMNDYVSSPIETQTDQRVNVMERMIKQFLSRAFDYYSATYPNNPQMIGEIGPRDVDGYVLGPDYFLSIPKSQRKSDEQERSDFMFASLKAFKELGIERINLFTFLLGDYVTNWEGGTGLNTGFKQPISPAYRVIKSILDSN